ncbi:MAG: hypothetical protein GY771_15820 [bacterium]|nr:hypothetical protein [bacterium]
MVRTITLTTLSLAFLPIALILILIGINALSVKKKRGIWMKLAVLVNSSLVLALGVLGCGGSANGGEGEEEMVLCYEVAMSDYTQVPDKFENSDDWQMLENRLTLYESYISSRNTEMEETADAMLVEMIGAIDNLHSDGLISKDDADLLSDYVYSRAKTYNMSICGVKCYKPAPIKPGKPEKRQDIIDAMDSLRAIYASGGINDKGYDTALANLEKELELYTGKEDNAVLRQLLLDLADGMGGTYYE